MVYNGKPYQNGWFGGTTIFGNPHNDPCSKVDFLVSPTLIAIEMRVGYEVVHLTRVTVVPREVLQKYLDLGYMYVYTVYIYIYLELQGQPFINL